MRSSFMDGPLLLLKNDDFISFHLVMRLFEIQLLEILQMCLKNLRSYSTAVISTILVLTVRSYLLYGELKSPERI